METWIIKINPQDNFRIAESLKEACTRDRILALENIQCNPQEGDTLYLYQIGRVEPGLCGVGVVIAPSQSREQPEWQRQFNQLPYDPAAERLLVRIERFSVIPVQTKWRANAGTTQRCPPNHVEEFAAAALTLQAAAVGGAQEQMLSTEERGSGAGLKADARTRYLRADNSLKEEIYRMALLITQRAGLSRTQTSRLNPERVANPPIETQQMLYDKWEAQKGRCGLCKKYIPIPPAPGLLQPSPDRQDSTNTSYATDNVHITHLGCNYAKNKYGIDAFEQWLQVVSDRVLQDSQDAT